MSDTTSEILTWVIGAVVIVVFVWGMFAGANFLSSLSCEAKTTRMGFAHSYSFMGGCQIEVSPDKWIPLDSYYYKQP